ncbi:MAG: thiamine phosphate synthase [Oscillospiraceae bacterium]|nr:thiamine phosphate synthase [Oscillospiraceae bacterium]
MKEIVVTNRLLCSGDFMQQIEKALQSKPWGLLLREKDLPTAEYTALAAQVAPLCRAAGVKFIAYHPHAGDVVHMPFSRAESSIAQPFSVSVHSVEEAVAAQSLGAALVIAGHIFATQSKAGLPPRGLDFLRAVCESVTIPVFAIGGVTEANARDCVAAGAAGVCRMSAWFR